MSPLYAYTFVQSSRTHVVQVYIKYSHVYALETQANAHGCIDCCSEQAYDVATLKSMLDSYAIGA